MMLFLDTETTGLDPRADRLVLVGFARSAGDPVVLQHGRDRERIQRVLDADATFVAHNVGFDMAMLEHHGYRLPPPERWQDTMLVAHVAGECKPGELQLRRLTQKLVDAGELDTSVLAHEDLVKQWLARARRVAKKHGFPRPQIGHAPTWLLWPYLDADVRTSRAVYRHYSARLGGQQRVLDLEQRCLAAVYATEQRGVPLDVDAARELRDRTAVQVDDLRTRLHDLAGRPFNLNSARQIERALQDRGANLDEVPRTPNAGLPMFTAQTLPAIGDELADTLLQYRDEKKMLDYVHGLLAHTHGDRLYGTFRQLGTETGRMSSSSPNLQNIPKSDLRVRYVVRAGAGRLLIDCDQDNVELRVLAAYAPGGELERAFAEGVDLHQRTADELDVDRDTAKTVNYAVLYGAGAPRIAQQLGVDRSVAERILDDWYGLYPEVGKLKWQLTRAVRKRGYIRSAGGRRHRFDQPNHMMLNRLISGSCAEIFKAALVELNALGMPMVLLVHDEVVAEVREEEAGFAARLLEEALARGMGRAENLVAHAQIADRWSDFKEPGWVPDVYAA
jgi:DNA polymerase I-like protein with 3'-5' exonuclease and polymerase domains